MLDVTMGTLDGAEICELFGLYILDKLFILLHMQNVRLYRHDDLAVVKNTNGPKLRKEIIAILKAESLSTP